MTGPRLTPDGNTVNFNIRITNEQSTELHNLIVRIRHHNADPTIRQADVLRAIFARGIAALNAELDQLKAQQR